jgi:hypothetical protein
VDPVKFPNGSFLFGYDEALKNPAWMVYAHLKINTTYPNSTGDKMTDRRLGCSRSVRATWTRMSETSPLENVKRPMSRTTGALAA